MAAIVVDDISAWSCDLAVEARLMSDFDKMHAVYTGTLTHVIIQCAYYVIIISVHTSVTFNVHHTCTIILH